MSNKIKFGLTFSLIYIAIFSNGCGGGGGGSANIVVDNNDSNETNKSNLNNTPQKFLINTQQIQNKFQMFQKLVNGI